MNWHYRKRTHIAPMLGEGIFPVVSIGGWFVEFFVVVVFFFKMVNDKDYNSVQSNMEEWLDVFSAESVKLTEIYAETIMADSK